MDVIAARDEKTGPVAVRFTLRMLIIPGWGVESDRIVRRAKSGQQKEVSCHTVLKDYQMLTGALTSMNNNGFKGTVFLGVVNLVIPHVSIVYNRAHAATNKPKFSHVDSLK
ncbi:Hypothetical protein PHPALM_818 [Phytophthora palmivora]|uniref:Uncharacterized protein n=1 Tax=Phytophthora palmivora TaxID=4796 RepID=A0A2P4YTW5_9STRA|nr:Hypothetical protein PHPALM_818 [Phytophthora palmivora]